MKRFSVFIVVAMLAGLALAACGGGATASDPVATVKDMMQAVVDKKLDKITDYACAAKKDEVKQQFDLASALGGGLDPQKILDVMTFSIENAEYNKLSENGDKATVQMKAKLIIKIDKEKFKSVITDMAKAQGQDLPADQLGPMVDQAATQLEQGQNIDNTVELVKENGKWLICPSN